jgi:hypothetical protein
MAKHIYVQVRDDVYKLDKGQENLFSSGTLLKPKQGKVKYLAQCKAELRRYLMNVVDGTGLVFAVIRSVSASGMSRNVSFFVHTQKTLGPHLQNISELIADVLDWQCKDGAIVIKGCGMDMIHHTAESLSRVLYDNPDRIPTQTL